MARENTVRLAVVGVGLIGQNHAKLVKAEPNIELTAIVDPSEVAKEIASQLAVPLFQDLGALLASNSVDGVILSTPTPLHFEGASQCIAAGMPVLIEKPVTGSVEEGEALEALALAQNAKVLVGHHRRHNPLIAKAKSIIQGGALGRIVAVSGLCLLMKPDEYFEPDWRRQKGAGPVLTNLIHDMDLLRHLMGEVVSVFGMESNAIRGNEVEDTASIMLRFASGALGTITVSDCAVSPWSWELTAAENTAYPATGQSCYQISGTHGSLEFPTLRHWKNADKRSWYEPINSEVLPFEPSNPLVNQIRHFASVIKGDEAPLVSLVDGLQSLRLVEAIKTASSTGRLVDLR